MRISTRAQPRLKCGRGPQVGENLLLPFPPPSSPLFLPLFLHSLFLSFHSLHFSFDQPIKSSWTVWGCPISSHGSTKMIASCKSWRGPNTLGPQDLQSWRGRVHSVVAPMHIDKNDSVSFCGESSTLFFFDAVGQITDCGREVILFAPSVETRRDS